MLLPLPSIEMKRQMVVANVGTVAHKRVGSP
jgi:hypothetical protein